MIKESELNVIELTKSSFHIQSCQDVRDGW